MAKSTSSLLRPNPQVSELTLIFLKCPRSVHPQILSALHPRSIQTPTAHFLHTAPCSTTPQSVPRGQWLELSSPSYQLVPLLILPHLFSTLKLGDLFKILSDCLIRLLKTSQWLHVQDEIKKSTHYQDPVLHHLDSVSLFNVIALLFPCATPPLSPLSRAVVPTQEPPDTSGHWALETWIFRLRYAGMSVKDFEDLVWKKRMKRFRLPWWYRGQESTCQCRGHGFDPWPGKTPHASE